ncbi:hypothetical protein D3C73_1387690 [compost metagenome]
MFLYVGGSRAGHQSNLADTFGNQARIIQITEPHGTIDALRDKVVQIVRGCQRYFQARVAIHELGQSRDYHRLAEYGLHVDPELASRRAGRRKPVQRVR